MKSTRSTTFIIFAIVYICCSLMVGCGDEESSPVNIIVNPNDAYFTINSDGAQMFNVNAFSDNGSVKHVVIESLDGDMNKTILLDTNINQMKTIFDYVYRPQKYSKDMQITLKFTAYSSYGESISTSRIGKVVKVDKLLKEYTGFTIYSSDSKKENGFNINQLKTIFVSIVPPADVDIYDYADSLVTEGNRFKREWRSMTNVSFIKYNGFDYSSATEKSVKDAYSIGVKQPTCYNISNDDVIIVGRGDEALGVIKVVNVYDNGDVLNDRYFFNIKPLGK